MNTRNDILKLIGIIAMTIDHLAGILIISDVTYFIMRSIGRLAIPIFAYHIAVGYEHTRNFKRYALRLLLLAIISQPIFMLFTTDINIVFYLLIGLISIRLYDLYHGLRIPLFLFFICMQWVGFYGYVIISILLFHLLCKRMVLNIVLQGIMMSYVAVTSTLWHLFFIAGVAVTYVKWKIHVTLPRYTFYLFYPGHLLILYVLKMSIT